MPRAIGGGSERRSHSEIFEPRALRLSHSGLPHAGWAGACRRGRHPWPLLRGEPGGPNPSARDRARGPAGGPGLPTDSLQRPPGTDAPRAPLPGGLQGTPPPAAPRGPWRPGSPAPAPSLAAAGTLPAGNRREQGRGAVQAGNGCSRRGGAPSERPHAGAARTPGPAAPRTHPDAADSPGRARRQPPAAPATRAEAATGREAGPGRGEGLQRAPGSQSPGRTAKARTNQRAWAGPRRGSLGGAGPAGGDLTPSPPRPGSGAPLGPALLPARGGLQTWARGPAPDGTGPVPGPGSVGRAPVE